MAETDLILAARTEIIEPARVQGEVGPLTADGKARLRVSSKGPEFPVVSGSVNISGAANGFAVDVTDAASLTVHMKNAGSSAMTTGIHQFEASVDSTDGVDGTWFSIQGVRTNSNTVESSRQTVSLAAYTPTAYAWQFAVAAIRFFRIRATTNTSPNSDAVWTCVRSSYPIDAVPGIQDHGIIGTVGVAGTVAAVPPTGTTYTYESTAGTNGTIVIAAPRSVTEVTAFNPTAAAAHLKLYNKTSQPTLASDTPFLTIPIPAGALVSVQLGAVGRRFSAGVSLAITAGAAKTDTAAAGAGIQVGLTHINN